MKPFTTVEFWSKVFDILGWISPFKVIYKILCLPPHRPPPDPSVIYNTSVEVYVWLNLAFSIIFLLTSSVPGINWWEFIFIFYGTIHVFEVVIYKIKEVLFVVFIKEPVHDIRRFLILTLYNYVEIIFWFALFYRNFDWAFETGKTCLYSFLIRNSSF